MEYKYLKYRYKLEQQLGGSKWYKKLQTLSRTSIMFLAWLNCITHDEYSSAERMTPMGSSSSTIYRVALGDRKHNGRLNDLDLNEETIIKYIQANPRFHERPVPCNGTRVNEPNFYYTADDWTMK